MAELFKIDTNQLKYIATQNITFTVIFIYQNYLFFCNRKCIIHFLVTDHTLRNNQVWGNLLQKLGNILRVISL